MGLYHIIIYVLVGSAILAAADRCTGGHFGIGCKLDEALTTMGPMCIPMVGMLLLAPTLGKILTPVVVPVFTLLGADPAMFPSSILACDMGGYALATSMAIDPQAGQFSGCILSCSLGGAISFVMPVGFSMVRKDYHPYFITGVLIGIITIPVGLVAGGISAGFDFAMVMRNTMPILIFSLIIMLGLWKWQKITLHIFSVLGQILLAVSTIGFAIGIIQELTDIVIIPGMDSILDGIKVVGSVVIVLCGAYPLFHVITKVFGKALRHMETLLGIDQTAVVSILAGLANIMPILDNCNRMSPAGVTVATAFAISGTCTFGDHLGFISSVDQAMVLPMIVSKLVGCILAIGVAVAVCRKNKYGHSFLPLAHGPIE